jgi:hypothetical protein
VRRRPRTRRWPSFATVAQWWGGLSSGQHTAIISALLVGALTLAGSIIQARAAIEAALIQSGKPVATETMQVGLPTPIATIIQPPTTLLPTATPFVNRSIGPPDFQMPRATVGPGPETDLNGKVAHDIPGTLSSATYPESSATITSP